MGFLDDIFGGGGGGGFEATQLPALTPEQSTLLQNILSGLTSQAGAALTPFTGPRVAGISPLQQTGFGLAGGLAPGIGAGIDLFGQTLGQFDPARGQEFLGTAQGALQQGLGFDPTQDILRAFEPSRQLALRGFQEDIVPNLLERFGATSGPSGPLNRALAEAGAGLELGLSAQTAPFIGQAALQQPGLQFQGAGLGGNLAQLPGLLAQQGTQLGAQGVDLLSQLLNIGGVQRGITGQQIAGDVATALDPRSILSQFGPLGLGTQAFTNVIQPQGQGAFQSLLPALGSFGGGGGFGDILGSLGGLFGGASGAGAGAAGAGAFGLGAGIVPAGMLSALGAGAATGPLSAAALGFSDERLKSNIKSIENAIDKVKQIDGKTFQIQSRASGGVIAQDVEKVLPDIVSEHDGFKVIDYNAIIGLLVNAVKELAE